MRHRRGWEACPPQAQAGRESRPTAAKTPDEGRPHIACTGVVDAPNSDADRCGSVADGGHRKLGRPSREAWTYTTCAGWTLLECFPRLKVFQRSTRVFHSL